MQVRSLRRNSRKTVLEIRMILEKNWRGKRRLTAFMESMSLPVVANCCGVASMFCRLVEQEGSVSRWKIRVTFI